MFYYSFIKKTVVIFENVYILLVTEVQFGKKSKKMKTILNFLEMMKQTQNCINLC